MLYHISRQKSSVQYNSQKTENVLEYLKKHQTLKSQSPLKKRYNRFQTHRLKVICIHAYIELAASVFPVLQIVFRRAVQMPVQVIAAMGILVPCYKRIVA